MANVVCTAWLAQIGPVEAISVAGSTVIEVLDNMAANYPRLKDYILDDQQRVRKHVAIFINSNLQPRNTVLSYQVGDTDEIYIMQALSGG